MTPSLILLLLICLLFSSCGASAQKSQAATAPPPSLVEFVKVQNRDVPIYSEYAAQTYPRDTLLAVFIVPVLFTVMERLSEKRHTAPVPDAVPVGVHQ